MLGIVITKLEQKNIYVHTEFKIFTEKRIILHDLIWV